MGSDWRGCWRAHRIIFWVVGAFRWPGDRRYRGRTHWGKTNHESWPRRLGHISGRSGWCYRKTFHRAHNDCDLSDERAIAAMTPRGRARLRRAGKDWLRGASPYQPGKLALKILLPASKLVLQSYFDARTRPRRGRSAGYSDLDGARHDLSRYFRAYRPRRRRHCHYLGRIHLGA